MTDAPALMENHTRAGTLTLRKPITREQVKERYPDLSPGEGMEQIMLEMLNGTWRTWMRGELPSFTFLTEEKPKEWSPNYWKIMAGGQGRPYPEIRNGMAQESVEAVKERRKNGPSHYVQRQKI